MVLADFLECGFVSLLQVRALDILMSELQGCFRLPVQLPRLIQVPEGVIGHREISVGVVQFGICLLQARLRKLERTALIFQSFPIPLLNQQGIADMLKRSHLRQSLMVTELGGNFVFRQTTRADQEFDYERFGRSDSFLLIRTK